MALAVDCIRCYNERGNSVIACEGDLLFELRNKCGEPDHVEVVAEVSSGRYRSRTDEDEERGGYAETFSRIEHWYYNCGSGRFYKVITTGYGKVLSIANGDERGDGPNKCF